MKTKPSISIKICGVTSPSDAQLAVALGADQIGIIVHPGTPRSVSIERAKIIATATRQAGGTPVAVFVEESPQEIREACEYTGIAHVQLHGEFAASSLKEIANGFTVIYADSRPQQQHGKGDKILCDSPIPGSGEAFDWKGFNPPTGSEWILAGGLSPQNVAEAIHLLSPDGVDVSSGVENGVKGKKDPLLLYQFIQQVQQA